MLLGIAYYPELRAKDQIPEDLRLMQEAGISMIRIGEFAWCEMEPAEGSYDWQWLDEVIGQAAARGIATVLCTPTAAPPAWLAEKHPEMAYVDNFGRARPFGSRRHYCYNHPVYRVHAARIAAVLAERYKDNPHVIGYQIDNELAQEGTGRCRCSLCQGRFHEWLERKYNDIRSLNECWGTAFWSQRYDHFGQIPLPVATIETATAKPLQAFFDNPSLRLDFERFCSDSLIGFQNVQAEALRRGSPGKIVTTNATGSLTNSIDYYKATDALDVFAMDSYPNLRGRELLGPSFDWAFARGIRNAPFWILELGCGGGHALWGFEGRLQPYPGAVRQSILHAFASGAEVVTLFQFIQFTHGAEQLNHALLDSDSIPRRRYFDVKRAADDLAALRPILESTWLKHDIAICFDYESLWALGIKPVHRELQYERYIRSIYEQLAKMGLGADVIPVSAPFERYKAVILSTPFVMDDAFRAKLKDYVNGGGVLLSTFLAAVKNEHNAGTSHTLPGGLNDLFGIRVSEWEPVFPESAARLRLQAGNRSITGANRYWTETLEAKEADLIGVYADTFREGQGVISRNRYGQGMAFYAGAGLDEALSEGLLSIVASEAGVRPLPYALPDGVEAVRRIGANAVYDFIFNGTMEGQTVILDRDYLEVLTKLPVSGPLTLEPKQYIVLRANTEGDNCYSQ